MSEPQPPITAPGTVTRTLNGQLVPDRRAVEAEIYRQIRVIARDVVRGEPRRDITAVTHEAWIKLQHTRIWHSRAHFFGSAAHAVRQVLADQARRRLALKRRTPAGGSGRTELTDEGRSFEALLDEAASIDEALRRFAKLSSRAAEVASMRLFGDVSVQLIAEHLGTCERTVERDWRLAKAWLAEELGDR